MFNNKPDNKTPEIMSNNKNPETTNASINLIGTGTAIEGDLKSNGDVRIDGNVYGSVQTKAKAVIGATGVIEGDINSQNADISGTVKGKITCADLLFLKSTARVSGDIITGKLVVEVGASFTGSCNMGPLIKEMKHGNDKPAAPTLQEKSA
jgi:cytoskeletal protein CcmA (bactofilin family)